MRKRIYKTHPSLVLQYSHLYRYVPLIQISTLNPLGAKPLVAEGAPLAVNTEV